MLIRRLLQRSVNLVPWRVRDWIRRVPVVAGLQRSLLSHFVGADPFLHEINAGPGKGLRVMITLPADKGFWTGTYESHFIGAVAAAVKPRFICFDVGGFHGFVSGVMALAGAKEVRCFEPLPANLLVIRQLADLNPALPIEVCDYALGAENGHVDFAVMDEDSMGKLEKSPYQLAERGQATIPVKIRSLDSLLSEVEIAPPDLIKLDVEGAELDVLLGARHLLANHHPEIFAEIHSPELLTRCKSLLQELEYEVTPVTSLGASQPSATGICHVHARFRGRNPIASSSPTVEANLLDGTSHRARSATKAWARRTVSLGMEALLFARSRRFEPREQGRTLVISPHPDDECLGCGAFLARAAHDGPESIHVAYVTDGSRSHPGHPSISAVDLAHERRNEAQAALAVLGVPWGNTHHLNLEDGSLAKLDQAASQNLIEHLRALFDELQPSRILLPLRYDGSSEHDASFDHAARALQRSTVAAQLLEFPVWAAWRPQLLLKSLRTARVVHRFDARPWLGQKEAALQCHRSQLQAVAPWREPVVSHEFVSYFIRPYEYYFEFPRGGGNEIRNAS